MDVKIVDRGSVPAKIRMKMPYDKIAEALLSGKDVIVTGISRQVAFFAAKKLSRLVKDEVVALPTVDEGEKGYLFTTKGAIIEWARKEGINVEE